MLNEAAAEPELGKSLVGVCLKSTEVNEQARRSHASEEAETIFQLATATASDNLAPSPLLSTTCKPLRDQRRHPRDHRTLLFLGTRSTPRRKYLTQHMAESFALLTFGAAFLRSTTLQEKSMPRL